MNLNPETQLNLYGLNKSFNELVELNLKKKLPSKILFSGPKGIGKCTLAYHLINFILSNDEEFSYDLINNTINNQNKSYKLIQNGSNPNFTLIDVLDEKKSIDINQIRDLIIKLQKSSFNDKPRFILIDNIENLNTNSVNALLKILEEPTKNTHFILINSNKKILPTILSRCLNFKISLTNKEIINVCNKLFESNLHDLINSDLLDYYLTPGKIYNLLKISKEKEINISKLNLKEFVSLSITESFFKQDVLVKNLIYDFMELYLVKKISLSYNNIFSHFLNRIRDTRKFNLDEESLFIEINSKLLNG